MGGRSVLNGDPNHCIPQMKIPDDTTIRHDEGPVRRNSELHPHQGTECPKAYLGCGLDGENRQTVKSPVQ